MKVTLEFSLYDEMDAYHIAYRGIDYLRALMEIDEYFREKTYQGFNPSDAFYKILENNNIDLTLQAP